ncbi:MAG: MBL fold metallo-hydrolase [Myxococcota bacterium]|jgi:metallo-beta-lactamase family protein|nr:MBL fold metallo-hydrolase [Myxococcota bacterium]
MRIKFHGANSRVTGSCIELQDAELDVHFLVDCGSTQEPNEDPSFPFDPRSLDCVLLTHAHIDHCGRLPLLAKQGFRGKIYCTKATEELARLSLADAALLPNTAFGADEVALLDSLWAQPHGQVMATGNRLATDVTFRFDRAAHILGSVWLTVPWKKDGRLNQILFSGDLGPSEEDELDGNGAEPFLMRSRFSPHWPNGKNALRYAVLESTYGGRERRLLSPDDRRAALRAQLREVVGRGGQLLIPTFSIDRLQNLIIDLSIIYANEPELFEQVPVFLDAPLGQRVNQVYAKHLLATELWNQNSQRFEKHVKMLWMSRELSRSLGLDEMDAAAVALAQDLLDIALLEEPGDSVARLAASSHHWANSWRRVWQPAPAQLRQPAVIITGGGMCEGGKVLQHLPRVLRDERSRVLLTGYSAKGSNARRLLNLPAELASRRLLGPEYAVLDIPPSELRAQIEQFSAYSAHADQASLLRWAFPNRAHKEYGPSRWTAAERFFLNHGEPDAREALKQALLARGAELQGVDGCGPVPEVELPHDSSPWFQLDLARWEDDSPELAELEACERRCAELRAKLGRR